MTVANKYGIVETYGIISLWLLTTNYQIMGLFMTVGLSTTRWGPIDSQIGFKIQSLWFMVLITIVFLGFIHQLITRGPQLISMIPDS